MPKPLIFEETYQIDQKWSCLFKNQVTQSDTSYMAHIKDGIQLSKLLSSDHVIVQLT